MTFDPFAFRGTHPVHPVSNERHDAQKREGKRSLSNFSPAKMTRARCFARFRNSLFSSFRFFLF